MIKRPMPPVVGVLILALIIVWLVLASMAT